MEKSFASLIGKPVIVRANVAGVHCGIAIEIDGCSIHLKDAYRLWDYYTRDKTGSVSDIAANGLILDKPNQIGARLPSVLIVNKEGLEIAEMNDAAYQSFVENDKKPKV